jgi:Flp pilus assembly protein TadB
VTPSDDGRYDATSGRHETEVEKLDRNLDDLLQELRVSQTGVQILFAFLLTLAFTQRFEDIDEFQRNTYVVTLMASVAATILFIAPVAYHRIVFRQHMRSELVRDGNRMAMAGLCFLAIAMSGAILLIVDVVLGDTWATVLTAVVLLFMLVLWYVLPLVQRRRHHP